MGLADKLNDNIVSRGLGGDEKLVINKQVGGNLKIAVYQNVGLSKVVNSFANDVPGWKFDKEIVPARNSEFETLGGHKALNKEGILESDFKGSVIYGCEVSEIKEAKSLKINENYTKWFPSVEPGVYSTLGEKNCFFGKNYQSAIATSSNVVVKDSWLLDTIRVSMYKRNENFINVVRKSFDFDFDTNSIIGYKTEQIKDTVEINNNQASLYLKHFPIQGFSTPSLILQNKIDRIVESLGIVYFRENVNIQEGEYEIKYSWVPLIEYEVYKKENRIGDQSIKPYEYESPNGLIEISNEEKHVTSLVLESSESEVFAGAGSLTLRGTCLNSRGKPVDEIAVDFFGDDGKDILFEGNLSTYTSGTNGDGVAFSQAYFPLNRNSLSIVSEEADNNRIYLPQSSEVDYSELVAENILVFEMLKIDPFYGSNGISIGLRYNYEEDVFEIREEDFERLVTKIKNSKNNLDKSFVNFADIVGCGSVYNTGWVSFKLYSFSYRSRIEVVGENKIKLSDLDMTRVRAAITDGYIVVKMFIKNDVGENSNNHLDKALYKFDSFGNAALVKPIRIGSTLLNGNSRRFYLEFEDSVRNPRRSDDLFGYRIFANQNKIFRAECIDPATGRKILSNEVNVKVSLPTYYRSEIKLVEESDETSGYIGIGSYIMIDENLEQSYSLNSGAQQ